MEIKNFIIPSQDNQPANQNISINQSDTTNQDKEQAEPVKSQKEESSFKYR
ncbi:hypothetical protein [Legionella sainthelensi]|uniref:hypothetical protein n=1 Tax=Legionella sainthelensi TaxID=28087 RepID=UPI0013EE7A2F|nr:hypothetical protein [Legionella sainthelensi]